MGGEHLFKAKGNYPAYGTECKSCGKANHWARVCRSKQRREPRYPSRRRGNRGRSYSRSKDQRDRGKSPSRDSKEISDQFEEITFESITVNASKPTQNDVFVSAKNNLERNDNRSTVGNILPLRLYRRMYPQNLTSIGFPKPGALENSTTELTGTCKIRPCEFEGRKSVALFYVTDAEGPAIIGLPTCLELDLVTMNCSVQKNPSPEAKCNPVPAKSVKDKDDLTSQYQDCFDGIGKFQGQYHISVDLSVPPVVHAMRRVPLNLPDDIKNELNEMEAQGIITKIKEGASTA